MFTFLIINMVYAHENILSGIPQYIAIRNFWFYGNECSEVPR
jgi:hypothetical protein